MKELASVKEEEDCQTVRIFSVCSHKSFTEVNLWILWAESHFMFSPVIWNILRQQRSRHGFIWHWFSNQLRNAGGNRNVQEFLSPFNAAHSWKKQRVDHALSHLSESFVPLCEKDTAWPQLPSTVQLGTRALATVGLQLATATTHYSGCIPVLAGIYSHRLQTNWKPL